jgi:outer membrane receptor protein involved in Fe transport
MLKSLLFALLVGALSVAAFAQTSTATIRGKVTAQGGAALAGIKIEAVGTASGFTTSVTAAADGSYQLGGLTPGEYKLTVSAEGFNPQSWTARVLVGQNVTVDLVLTPTSVVSESITVVGEQLIDTRTSEASTNVTTQQIENLPQDDRNFLKFATLAPGIHLSTDPQRKVISSDAQPAEQTNVFIDGVSFKNDVLQGGLVGQDSSRGNPFPQNAVQEFRVVTQNYSAQYDKAASAIITAITKSGGNEIRGQAFWFYQPKQWVAPLPKGFQYSTLTTNASYERNQPGFSLGGPIIHDKLHFFLSYEGDDEKATTGVALGFGGRYLNQLGQYTGNFPGPFKETLAFGKLSWQPIENQLVDFSGNYRYEHETRDFGGQTSFQSATDLKNAVYGGTLRDTWNNNRALNIATLSLQDYYWNPTPLNPNLVGMNFEGVIRIGGNSTTQKFDQQRLELRDDYSFAATQTRSGDHNLQAGFNADRMRYQINKSLTGNPEFDYRTDQADLFGSADPQHQPQPYQALFGFGNPKLATNNNEFGVYGQDNWIVNPRLTVTLGLRWDYETSQLDQDYVTPANIAAALAGTVDSSYFSNGHNRSQYKNEIQPRLGFSYDLSGNGKTILFGGAGRYYDRLFLNATLDERFRLQYPTYNIQFGPGGIPWEQRYLTPEGLHALIASGKTNPEIYLLNNNTKPPYSNQWNLGIRQSIGKWVGSLSYNGVRGYHGFTWLSQSGICCKAPVPGYGNLIISDPRGKDYWYSAGFLTIDRPYSNGWGVHLAYTHAKAEQTGNDLFSLDFPSAAAYGRHAVPGSEKDRIVANGTFGLPWDVRFATTISLGSGAAFNVLDFSQGFDLPARERTHPFLNSIYPDKTWGFADRTVDFRLEKDIRVGHDFSVGLIGEVFNAFNWASYGCLDNFISPGGNPNFGNPSCTTNLGRREQVGLKINF